MKSANDDDNPIKKIFGKTVAEIFSEPTVAEEMKNRLDEFKGLNDINPRQKIAFCGVDRYHLLEICKTLAERHGTKNLLGSKKINQYENAPELEISEKWIDSIAMPYVHSPATRFKRISPQITWIEALNLIWVAQYHKQKLKNNAYDFLIGVDVEEGFKQSSELMISDGVLLYLENEKMVYSHIFQQALAQNLYGKNKNTNLEKEILFQIDRKAKKRPNYAKGCGLIIGVVSDGQRINVRKIIKESEADKYYPAYAVIYEKQFKKVRIYPLNKKVLRIPHLLFLSILTEEFFGFPDTPKRY